MRFDGENCITYTMENSGLTNDFIWSLAFDHNGVLWIGTDNGISTYVPDKDVSVDSALDHPEVSMLKAATYPNPFNPTTTIEFTIPSLSDVTLSVYSISGQKVATLVDRHLSAGRHSAMFYAYDLASGLYFYKLKAGSMVKMGKMLLLK